MPEPGATRFIWRRNVRSEKAWLPANTTRATLMRGPSWISYLATAAAVGVSSRRNRTRAWGWPRSARAASMARAARHSSVRFAGAANFSAIRFCSSTAAIRSRESTRDPWNSTRARNGRSSNRNSRSKPILARSGEAMSASGLLMSTGSAAVPNRADSIANTAGSFGPCHSGWLCAPVCVSAKKSGMG